MLKPGCERAKQKLIKTDGSPLLAGIFEENAIRARWRELFAQCPIYSS
jgi:hypothetical protein